jgi:hypothetical protein
VTNGDAMQIHTYQWSRVGIKATSRVGLGPLGRLAHWIISFLLLMVHTYFLSQFLNFRHRHVGDESGMKAGINALNSHRYEL